MTSKRSVGCAAVGVALFYGTLVGVCQGNPMQPETGRLSPNEFQTRIPNGASRASGGTSIRFIATGASAGTSTPQSCQAILSVLLPYMQAYPHPDSWNWLVACDEAAWGRIRSRQGNQVGSGILAITNRPAHSTIIRGSPMLHPYGNDYRAQPEHIVAHELCHIYLDSSDESRVDGLATHWVEERIRKQLAILR